MAEAVVINKADGNNLQKARRAQAEFTNALHLFPSSPSGWTPLVKTCSSLYNTGIHEIWEMVGDYRAFVTKNSYIKQRRHEQSKYWMFETIREGIYNQVFNDPEMQRELDKHEKAVTEGRMTSFMAAASILNKYKSQQKTS